MTSAASASMAAALGAPDAHLLDEAAEWLVQLHSSEATERDREDCRRWQQQSPGHAGAWARAEQLMAMLGSLPPSLALPALDRSRAPARLLSGRRASVAKLAALLAAGPAALLAWKAADGPALVADHRTAVGERRDLRLPDGTQLTLNTARALDASFTKAQRLIRLHAGEILVTTAADTVAHPRPFRVSTREGVLEALGTRFSVRQEDGRTRVAVLEGAVRVQPRAPSPASGSTVLGAGQQASFTAETVAAAQPADQAATAWTQGMLLADNLRLEDLAAELARYRHGTVRCEPAVAGLRVSGAFPIAQPERTLAMLEATYPVAARRRLGGLWVTLVAN